jgi:selenocysteine lyase/cysteine desulfurase
VELFHRFDIPVAVDGAHAAGQLKINLKDIGADYYMGTMHKWMYTIQGVAFLYLHDFRKPLSPLIVPKLLGQGLTREFCAASIPQKDLTNWITAIYAMEFVEHCCGGWTEVRKYTHRMAEEAQATLCKDLNTDVFQATDCHYANMPLVRLPATEGASLASAKLLMTKLLQHGITAFVIRLAKKNAPPFLYVRLSMQIYHDSEDIARLSTRLKELSGQGYFAGFGFASHAVRSLVARPIRQLSSAPSSSSQPPPFTSQSSFVMSGRQNPDASNLTLSQSQTLETSRSLDDVVEVFSSDVAHASPNGLP